MAESKHTPGPWRVSTTGNISNCIEGPSGRPIYEGHDGYKTLATFQSCCSSQKYAEQETNAQANARLIAAAPDLLDALKYLVAHCKGLDRFEGNPINQAIADARAAIAKAEGR